MSLNKLPVNSLQSLLWVAAALTITMPGSFANPIQDPIADYLTMTVQDRIEYAGTPEVVMRVKIDVDGDGKDEVFVGTLYRYSGAKNDFNWVCYTPIQGGYQRATPADKDISIPSFEKIYSGNIAEISRQGLVYAFGITVDNAKNANITGVESLHYYTIVNNVLVDDDRGVLNLRKAADKAIYERYFGPNRKTRVAVGNEAFTTQQLRQMGYTIPNWDR